MARADRPRLSLRIAAGDERLLGPGKMGLLERVERLGSISAAARDMGMSYRRAWLLIDDMNRRFRQPVVESAPGGRHGGGAALTPFGRELLRRFRTIERKAGAVAGRDLAAIGRALRPARRRRRTRAHPTDDD